MVHAHAECRVALYLARLGEYTWLILYILGLSYAYVFMVLMASVLTNINHYLCLVGS